MTLFIDVASFCYIHCHEDSVLRFKLNYFEKGWYKLRFEESESGNVLASNIVNMPKLMDKTLYNKYIIFSKRLSNCEGMWCEKETYS